MAMTNSRSRRPRSSSSISSSSSSSNFSSPSPSSSLLSCSLSSVFSVVLLVYLCVISSGVAEEANDGRGYLPHNEKVCVGTAKGFSQTLTAAMLTLRNTYANCTYVVGNLELVFLDEENEEYDLSFLSEIREVTGYVLIAGNKMEHIPLHNLRIIRGNPPYYHHDKTRGYSLFVSINISPDKSTGLRELGFTKLTEILNGGVLFQDNSFLCYENTIHWKDIIPDLTPPVRYITKGSMKRKCGECHPKCFSNVTGKRHCWGEGPDQCQELTNVVCHPNCGDGRCYGSAPNQCCHPECAGGCTGPRRTDCFACRNMRDDNGCVSLCPPLTSYDKEKMMRVPNPNPKYAYGAMCVTECPEHMLIDEGLCVNSCSENKRPKDSRYCEKCENGVCPKTSKDCQAPGILNAKNIRSMENCTSVDGTITILGLSMDGDDHHNIAPLKIADLMMLNSVKEITGSLIIQSLHEDFVDLSFLSNLEVIHGRIATTNGQDAVTIMVTKMKSLELKSLKSIRNGNVIILHNSELCYVNDIDWSQLFIHPGQRANVQFNKAPKECIDEKRVCHEQCGTSGCWGPGPDLCIKCRNYVYEAESLCLNKCSDRSLLFHEANGKCAKCHSECSISCTGPGDTDCEQCAHAIMRNKDGKTQCIPECGDTMYPDRDKVCQRCHPYCGNNGCTGPNKNVGIGGCNKCEVGVLAEGKTIQCMAPDTDHCPRGFFMSNVNPFTETRMCSRCHELCLTCTGSSSEFCTECKFFGVGSHCIQSCPNLYFGNPDTKQCEECHHECRAGCSGPTTFNCTACSNFKIYYDEDSSKFNCTAECPPEFPYNVKDEKDDENRIVCADDSHPEVQELKRQGASEEKKKLIIILASTISGAIFLLALVACIGFFCFRRAQDNKKTAEFTAKITGHEEMEPLTPTSAKPDLAKMRLINQSELRRGNIIGSGAFGTVYKGIWIPQGENVKIPVAIKVLQEETAPGQSSELLNEARVMCSVEHICCVRILAVCMSSQMMLITQLMPHGCLLEYVRANKSHIGSKVLLDWCTQIAKGMAYLEERSVVHRDLAARNVLVQTPNQVKITDFGLAKLLDNETEEYHASGGLMPIKWLALECIQHRLFTHKTDVWSYGVTVWELFTYGKKPYEGIRTRDVPMMLEKGERLQQPMICTIDVYMIMVKCWMLESDSRPSFKELAEEFAKMSRDPGRYLVIEGDEFRKFPDSCFTGSDLDLAPIDGVSLDPQPDQGTEGDSLMRLQNVNFRKEELVRGMSEVPGDIMDAEEYLQPSDPTEYTNQSVHLGRSTTSLPYPPVFDRQNSRSPSAYNFDSYPRRGKGSHDELRDGPKIRDRKYGHLQSAARAKQERQQPRSREDSVSSRYTSDPIKFSKEKGEIEWPAGHNGGFSETPRSHHHHYKGSNHSLGRPYGKSAQPQQLPLDEDNYLQPQAACAYMDLSSKGYYQNEKAFGSTQAEPVLAELERSESRTSDRSRHGSVRSRLDSSNSKTGSTGSSHHNDNNAANHQPHPHHLHRQFSSPSSPTHPQSYTSPSHSMGSLKDVAVPGSPHPLSPNTVQLPYPPQAAIAASNPEYFDGLEMDYEEDDVWEPKKWNGYHNGYQPVPNGPASPLHTASTNAESTEEGRGKENGYPYYNDTGMAHGDSPDASASILPKQNGSVAYSNNNNNNNNNNGHMNTLPMVNTRATIQSGRHASESLV